MHLKSLNSSVIPCRSQGPKRGMRRAWKGFIWSRNTWEVHLRNTEGFTEAYGFVEVVHITCYNILNSVIWSCRKKTNKEFTLYHLPSHGLNPTSYNTQGWKETASSFNSEGVVDGKGRKQLDYEVRPRYYVLPGYLWLKEKHKSSELKRTGLKLGWNRLNVSDLLLIA